MKDRCTCTQYYIAVDDVHRREAYMQRVMVQVCERQYKTCMTYTIAVCTVNNC